MSRCWGTRSVPPDDGDGDDKIKPWFRPIWCVLLPAGAVASLPASNRLAARLWSYWCALGPAHLLSEQLEHEHSSFTESTLWNCTYVAVGSAPAPRLFSPSLKTCCTLFLSVLPQSALFHLKGGGWEEGGWVGWRPAQPSSGSRMPSRGHYFSVFAGCRWIPPPHYECYSAAPDSASFKCSAFLIYTPP